MSLRRLKSANSAIIASGVSKGMIVFPLGSDFRGSPQLIMLTTYRSITFKTFWRKNVPKDSTAGVLTNHVRDYLFQQTHRYRHE